MSRFDDWLASDNGKRCFILSDKKVKSNRNQFSCVWGLGTFWCYFCADILTGSKDTAIYKTDVSVLFGYIFHM